MKLKTLHNIWGLSGALEMFEKQRRQKKKGTCGLQWGTKAKRFLSLTVLAETWKKKKKIYILFYCYFFSVFDILLFTFNLDRSSSFYYI